MSGGILAFVPFGTIAKAQDSHLRRIPVRKTFHRMEPAKAIRSGRAERIAYGSA